MRCCCGMDCAKCIIYRATVCHDDALRVRAQTYYHDTFGCDIPLSDFQCLGVFSDTVFPPCRDCPWVKCCREHGVASCEACASYPCPEIRVYREKYVETYPTVEK